MLLTAQYSGTDYPVIAAGPPLVLQGTIPGGRAGRGMAKGSNRSASRPAAQDPQRDKSRGASCCEEKAFRHDKEPSRKVMGGSAFLDRPRATIAKI